MKLLILLIVILGIANCQQEQIKPVNIQPIVTQKVITQHIQEQGIKTTSPTISVSASTNSHPNPSDINHNPQAQFHQQHQIQQQKQQQYQESLNQQLPLYIQQQLSQFTNILQLPITQTFEFIIQSQQQLLFRWNPSKQKQLKIILDVFKIGSIGEFIVMNDAGQNQYVQIYTRNPQIQHWVEVGKVYRTKMFMVDFINVDYKQLKFVNTHSQPVFVQVGIEQLNYVVDKGVKDDSLTLTRNKMTTILLQSQGTEVKREHVYKWQWGYYENQKQHQLEILGFTGIELLAILMTSVVQMYLLKGLLDNRAVV